LPFRHIDDKKGNSYTIKLFFASGEAQYTDEFYEVEYRAESKVQFYREEYPDGNTKYTKIEYDEFGEPTVEEMEESDIEALLEMDNQTISYMLKHFED